MKTVKVVIAVIIYNNCIFAPQLGYGDFKDGWKFPGGKIESRKTPQQTLVCGKGRTGYGVEDYLETVEYDYPTLHLQGQIQRTCFKGA